MEKKRDRKVTFKKIIIPLLIFLNVINIIIWSTPMKGKDEYSEKLVALNKLAVVMTKNGSYRLGLDRPNLIKKPSYITWESSDSSIIDVTSCAHYSDCYLKPSAIGEATITIRYNDGKKTDSDSVYVSVIESEVINFYQRDGKIYADKISQEKYANLEEYENVASYTCKDIDCQFVTGDYHAMINDNNHYITVNINDKELNTDTLNRTYGCDRLLCNGNYKDNVEFSQIENLVDDDSNILAFILGNDIKYTGIYSVLSYSLKEVSFSGYTKINNAEYDLMLYGNGKDNLYNLTTNEIKTINFAGFSMGISHSNGMTYYFLSQNYTDYNKNCIILDSNYNFLFNSKVFEYAFIYEDKLYTYETVKQRKSPHVYNLIGNEITNYFSDNFEIYGYFSNSFVVGKQDNKLIVMRVSDKQIFDSVDEDITDYTFGTILSKDEATYLVSNNKLAPLGENECILFLYNDNGKKLYIRYTYLFGGNSRISSQKLSVKEVNSNE